MGGKPSRKRSKSNVSVAIDRNTNVDQPIELTGIAFDHEKLATEDMYGENTHKERNKQKRTTFTREYDSDSDRGYHSLSSPSGFSSSSSRRSSSSSGLPSISKIHYKSNTKKKQTSKQPLRKMKDDLDDMDEYNSTEEIYLERFKLQIRALDLQEVLVDYFSRLPCEVRLQRDNEDWIMTFLENKYTELEDPDLKQNGLSKNLLQNIGFVVPSKAVETMMLRSTQFGFQNHVNPIDTVNRFVLDEFRYNTALQHVFPLQHMMMKECKVEIIKISCVIKKEGNESPRLRKETILENSALVNKIQGEIAELRQSYQVLFHGTDEESAYDISLGGIAVSMGSQKRDFSDGKGFYLTNNYERAKNWAFTITKKPAILIYKIPKPCIEETKKLNLFEEQTSMLKWEAIVPANRSGILEWKMRKMLQQYQCIEGPVSVAIPNNSGISGRKTPPRKKVKNSYQLCIINEDFAEEISQCLSHVVLYNVLGVQDLYLYESTTENTT